MSDQRRRVADAFRHGGNAKFDGAIMVSNAIAVLSDRRRRAGEVLQEQRAQCISPTLGRRQTRDERTLALAAFEVRLPDLFQRCERPDRWIRIAYSTWAESRSNSRGAELACRRGHDLTPLDGLATRAIGVREPSWVTIRALAADPDSDIPAAWK